MEEENYELSSSWDSLLAGAEEDMEHAQRTASDEEVSLASSSHSSDTEYVPVSTREARGVSQEAESDFERSAQMDDHELDEVRVKYSIPANYIMRRADPGESSTKTDPEWVALFAELFSKGGLRLPLHSFFEEFLIEHNIPPGAFSYNGWKVLGAFVALCKELRIVPTVRRFDLFYEVKAFKKGVYFASARAGMKIFNTPSSTHPKRQKYFMCRPEAGWEIPTRWWNKKKLVHDPELTADDKIFVRRVKAEVAKHVGNVINTTRYCTEERMRACGVYPPLGRYSP